MNKQELINKIADEMDLTKGYAEQAYNVVVGSISEALADGEDVSLPGLGKFKVKERPARTSRNPKTGESVAVPAKTVVKFTPAKALKEAV